MQDQGHKCVCYMPEAWSVEYVRSHWKKLEPQADISFFQSWYWMDPWLTIARSHVRLLVFKDNQEIVGMTFVGKKHTKDHRFLRFLSAVPWGTGLDNIDVCAPEYNAPIVKSGYEKTARKALIHFLMTDARWDNISRIDCRRVSEDDHADYLSDEYPCDIYQYEDSAEVDLNYLRANSNSLELVLSKGVLSQIKRSIKLYEERFGDISYEIACTTTQAHNWFLELGKLNQKRFNKKGKKGAWDYPKLLQMHRALLDRYFSKECAEIVRVKSGNHVIGYLYNFIFRGKIYFYMGGFVYSDDNKLKPGLLTHYYAILHHLKHGKECYDFMAGNQKYKQRLGKPTARMVHFTLTKPSFKYTISNKISSIRNLVTKIFKKNIDDGNG